MEWWNSTVETIGAIAWRVAIFALAVIPVHLVCLLFKRRPCWFYGHDKNHLSIENDRTWTPTGNCGKDGHPFHCIRLETGIEELARCYVSKWACRKCPKMGYECHGSVFAGAWKIEFGKIVQDEKAWSEFKQTESPYI